MHGAEKVHVFVNKTQIIISDLPSLLLPKSNAGISLLSYITVSKFIDHLPFYRLTRKIRDLITKEL